MLLKLEKEGYVDIHASGWKTTPRGDDFVNRFDRVLTPLVDEPLRFA